MRAGLAEGLILSSDRYDITVADGGTLGHYTGVFTYNYGALPNLGTTFYGHPLLNAGFERGIVTGGILTGYQQAGTGGAFAISNFEVDAVFAFRSLVLGETRLLQSVIFAGNDTIFGSRDNDVLQGFTGNDLIWGNGGSDRIYGQQGLDRLYGLDGNDRINGGGDRDTIYGGNGKDALWGGAGNDFLFGESGNDWLIGGLGRDILTGGSGNDRFRFDSVDDSPPPSSQRDVIEDFGNGADRIDLRRIDANENQPGNQAFVFIGSAPFSGTAGELRYVPGMVSGDTTGDGSADFAIRMDGDPLLDAGDFLL
jgi:Ca2+-binding RTX toxin-like protein